MIGTSRILFKLVVVFHPKKKSSYRVFFIVMWHVPIIGIRVTMTTNKEHIEMLEQWARGLQDEVQWLGLGLNDCIQRLEESLKALSDVVLSSKAIQSSPSVKQRHTSQYQPDKTESSCLNIPPLQAKIKFSWFAGDDPTEWFNKVAQYFEFQRTP